MQPASESKITVKVEVIAEKNGSPENENQELLDLLEYQRALFEVRQNLKASMNPKNDKHGKAR